MRLDAAARPWRARCWWRRAWHGAWLAAMGLTRGGLVCHFAEEFEAEGLSQRCQMKSQTDDRNDRVTTIDMRKL